MAYFYLTLVFLLFRVYLRWTGTERLRHYIQVPLRSDVILIINVSTRNVQDENHQIIVPSIAVIVTQFSQGKRSSPLRKLHFTKCQILSRAARIDTLMKTLDVRLFILLVQTIESWHLVSGPILRTF